MGIIWLKIIAVILPGQKTFATGRQITCENLQNIIFQVGYV